MPFNVLLLPLLGGYLFITNWNRTRFHTKRYSGERLIFHSAIAGVLFLVLAFAVVTLARHVRPAIYGEWREVIPFPYTGTALVALALGWMSPFLLNRTCNRRPKEVRRTIEAWNDYVEVLLLEAQSSSRQVAVTLKNRKVYIGFVIQGFDPSFDRRYVTVLPTVSGYRRQDDLDLVLTTDYTSVYQQLIRDDERRLIQGVDDFQIAIPVSEVQSASLFDWKAFGFFRNARETAAVHGASHSPR